MQVRSIIICEKFHDLNIMENCGKRRENFLDFLENNCIIDQDFTILRGCEVEGFHPSRELYS